MAPVLTITQAEYQMTVSGALRRAFGLERHAHKRLANVAGTNQRTARNWLDDKATPQGLHLLRLMATVPELQAEVRRLTAMESDFDPEFERAFIGALHHFRRIKAGEPIA